MDAINPTVAIVMEDEDYSVRFDATTATVIFKGRLRLGNTADYGPITQLLQDLTHSRPPKITLDLRELQFLNSLGIGVLLKFVIISRKHQYNKIVFLLSNQVAWHNKPFNKVPRLLEGAELIFE